MNEDEEHDHDDEDYFYTYIKKKEEEEIIYNWRMNINSLLVLNFQNNNVIVVHVVKIWQVIKTPFHFKHCQKEGGVFFLYPN